MPRTRQQLENSRDQLRYAVQRIEKEIQLIEADILALGEPVRFDEDFLIREVIPILAKVPYGVTSSHLRKTLQTRGFVVPAGNFRTFLSRSLDRGYLVSEPMGGRAFRWRASEGALAALNRLQRPE